MTCVLSQNQLRRLVPALINSMVQWHQSLVIALWCQHGTASCRALVPAPGACQRGSALPAPIAAQQPEVTGKLEYTSIVDQYWCKFQRVITTCWREMQPPNAACTSQQDQSDRLWLCTLLQTDVKKLIIVTSTLHTSVYTVRLSIPQMEDAILNL